MFCEFLYTVRTGIMLHISCSQTIWILVFCGVFISRGSLYIPCFTTASTSVAFHKSSKSQVQILYLYKFYRPSKITTNLASRFLSLMNTPVTLHALEQEYATPTLIDTMFWTLSQQHLTCCPMNFEYKFERKWKKVIGGWEHSVNGDLSFILLPSNTIQVTQFCRILWVGSAAYMEEGGDVISDLVGLS
jgi:hypothetical protein